MYLEMADLPGLLHGASSRDLGLGFGFLGLRVDDLNPAIPIIRNIYIYIYIPSFP